jgi:hypothetical protein
VNGSQPTRTLLCDDPRAVENELVRRCREREHPLADRLLVLVPTSSARTALAGRLVRAAGGALVGVRVASLLGSALERLAAHGLPVNTSGLAGHVGLVRAIAAAPRLFGVLGRVDDGALVGARAAQELVDAGLDEHVGEAIEDLLAELPDGLAARTRELVAVAGRRAPGGEFEGGASSVFARAARLAHAHGAGREQVFLVAHEACAGPRADFAEALVRAGALALFTRGARGPFVQRLGLAPDESARESAPAAARGAARAQVRLFAAPDAESSARAAARRVAAALASGVRADDVLVVCTDAAEGTLTVARELETLGVPFSAPSARGDFSLALRPLAALARLLDERSDASAGTLAAAAADDRLSCELLARGAVRLADVGAARTRAAVHLVEELGGAPRPLAAWHAVLARFVDGDLRWPADAPPRMRLAAVLGALEQVFAEESAAALPLRGDEWALLLVPRLVAATHERVGGAGGGVRLVTPDAARATAAALVVLVGFERGAFPKRRADDPLLDERVRIALRGVLPDLATSSDARAADEALLADLLGAGDEVVVVHTTRDEKGRELPLAPALARRLAALGVEAWSAPRAGSAEDADHGPLTPLEWARLGGLARAHEGAGATERVLCALLEPLHDSAAAAEAHLANLLEHDSSSANLRGLGRVVASAFDRSRHVTRLEDFAKCGWAAHLANDLHIDEPATGELPTPDARAVGIAVHAALDVLLGGSGANTAPLEAGAARAVARPDDAAVEAALAHGVDRAAEAAHIGGVNLAAIVGARAWLAARARPLLEVAVRELWVTSEPLVLGAEREFALPLTTPEGVLELRFRADLVTVEGDVFVGTDFKTGKPKETTKSADKRTEKLVKALQCGERMQAAAYAVALRGLGRYLYLGGDEDDDGPRSSTIDKATADVHLAVTVARIERARARGLYLPRLVEADPDKENQPDACGRCAFIGACVQGDTGWRERMRRFALETEARLEREDDDDAAAAWSWFMLFDERQNKAMREDT